MGTISVGSSPVEERLDMINKKLETANVDRSQQFFVMIDKMKDTLNVLRWLN